MNRKTNYLTKKEAGRMITEAVDCNSKGKKKATEAHDGNNGWKTEQQ